MKKTISMLALSSLLLVTMTACNSGDTVIENDGYDVTFKVRGGSAVATQTVDEGGSIATEPQTTKQGYTFLGWYETPISQNKVTFPYKITGDTTLYAKWQLNASWQDVLDIANETSDEYNVTVFGEPMKLTHYKVTYCADPVDIYENKTVTHDYQSMNVYIPENATENSPIIVAVNNGGWMASTCSTVNDHYFEIQNGSEFTRGHTADNHSEVAGIALEAGYVVVVPGNRGKDQQDTDGVYVSHAPAGIVDIKSVIRYLRYNDEAMLGSAERIFITGLSGGGGLSSAVAASGNDEDYYSYLYEIGAAGVDYVDGHYVSTIDDNVFGTLAYCPVTDLDHNDLAYEWQFNSIRYLDSNYSADTENAQKKMAASNQMAAEYPEYLDSLGLYIEDGETLLDSDILKAKIKEYVELGAEKALRDLGTDLYDENNTFIPIPNFPTFTYEKPNDWLTIDSNGKATIDYQKFLEYSGDSTTFKSSNDLGVKGTPAFDNKNTGFSSFYCESDVYGSWNQSFSNITEWSWNNNSKAGDGIGYDDTGLTWTQYLQTDAGKALAKQMELNNPITLLTEPDKATAATYWYIRQGCVDYYNLPFASTVVLYYATLNNPNVAATNFNISWLTNHAGHYDAPEAYEWVAEIVEIADTFDLIESWLAMGNGEYELTNSENVQIVSSEPSLVKLENGRLIVNGNGNTEVTLTVTVSSDKIATTVNGSYNYNASVQTREITIII